MLETRTDWLAIQVLFIQYDTQGKDGPSQAKSQIRLVKEIRELFTKSTERISDLALEEGHLKMAHMADELEKFYAALPEGMFREVQPQ